MKVTNYNDYLASLKSHSETFDRKTDDIVLDIIQNVRQNGDSAVFEYGKKFDNVELASLVVSPEEIAEAMELVSTDFITAMKEAASNINEFHEKQVEQSWYYNKPNGIMLGQQVTPLDRVGIYVPGGKAAYPSTVLMNALPAKIAGVEEIYMTTPPQIDGKINPHILYAAKLAGVDKIQSLKDKLICHTAGSVSIKVLKRISNTFGVLYPLQSLSKFNVDIPEIPFLVDGNNEATKQILVDFANTLSTNVSIANDTERLKYHVSAVFVHNFANHIFALAEKYCETENINFDKLFPLMNELISKVEKFGAIKSQTGPAVRKDSITIQKHIEILSSHPPMKEIYKSMSDSIIELSNNELKGKLLQEEN